MSSGFPNDVVEALGLKEGGDVAVTPKPWTRSAKTLEERETALASLRSLQSMVPADFKFDREEASAR